MFQIELTQRLVSEGKLRMYHAKENISGPSRKGSPPVGSVHSCGEDCNVDAQGICQTLRPADALADRVMGNCFNKT